MKKKWLFLLAAAVLLVPWPVAYAYDSATAADNPVTIQPAEESLAPQIKAFGNAIGSVVSGELYRVDTTGAPADTLMTLYMTNTDELIASYRYMTLNIGVYVQTADGNWDKVEDATKNTAANLYLTIQGGLVAFILPQGGVYKITVDKGCFYCYGFTGGNVAASPTFNLDASQF